MLTAVARLGTARASPLPSLSAPAATVSTAAAARFDSVARSAFPHLRTEQRLRWTHFIDGRFDAPSECSGWAPVMAPATDEVLGEASFGDASTVHRASAAARRAAPAWRRDGERRGRVLTRLADALERHSSDLALLETADTGKPLSAAERDVLESARCFRFFAGWADKIAGRLPATAAPYSTTVRREPLGVVGLVTPWNYPIMMAAWKLAPALAAGNTVVIKPSEHTVLTTLALCALMVDEQCGVPAGVCNAVLGEGVDVGRAMALSPSLDKLSFTGSLRAGRDVLASSAASNLKPVTLELGGKSALVVMPDADMARAVEQAAGAIFYNAGQSCTAGSRLFLHESIHDEFVARLVAHTQQRYQPNDPYARDTVLGSMITPQALQRTLQFVQSLHDEGARLECGGARHGTVGSFMQPTIFSGCRDDMHAAREEIFGFAVFYYDYDYYYYYYSYYYHYCYCYICI